MITIFTPSYADEADTNAQNLSVKEIVVRLDPARCAVTMLHEGAVDPRIAARPNTRLLRWRSHGNTLRTILQLLAKTPDVYFFPREGPLDVAFLTARRRLRLKTAVVSYVVSGGLYNAPYSPARQRHIREADAVFVNNNYLGDLLKEKMGVVSSGTFYDGIDRRYYFPRDSNAENGPVTVLCAGSLRPYKRIPVVVREASRHPDARFRIAGTGEEEDLCKRLAAELGCRNVEFLGHLSQSQLGEEMRRADVFLLPSVVEGHPQVLLQAAGSGLPIVAMQVYRPDSVINGVTGFLSGNDEEFSCRLAELVRSQDLRRSMGKAALANARQFDWDIIAGRWQATFEKVVAKRREGWSVAG
jgi:glycosyltransferase involved in cell wall biosynthesis